MEYLSSFYCLYCSNMVDLENHGTLHQFIFKQALGLYWDLEPKPYSPDPSSIQYDIQQRQPEQLQSK